MVLKMRVVALIIISLCSSIGVNLYAFSLSDQGGPEKNEYLSDTKSCSSSSSSKIDCRRSGCRHSYLTGPGGGGSGVGATGAKGETGAIGATGVGTKGETGGTGAVGQTGPIGPTGPSNASEPTYAYGFLDVSSEGGDGMDATDQHLIPFGYCFMKSLDVSFNENNGEAYFTLPSGIYRIDLQFIHDQTQDDFSVHRISLQIDGVVTLYSKPIPFISSENTVVQTGGATVKYRCYSGFCLVQIGEESGTTHQVRPYISFTGLSPLGTVTYVNRIDEPQQVICFPAIINFLKIREIP